MNSNRYAEGTLKVYKQGGIHTKNGSLTLNKPVMLCYPNSHTNPIIPNGYKYLFGEWNTGLVIERISDGSQFTWIPVGSLKNNATLDGNNFNEQFGRRNNGEYRFSDTDYNEHFTQQLWKQAESIYKYGGYFLSRYSISRSSSNKAISSPIRTQRWTDIRYLNAVGVAESFEGKEGVTSHLTFGAEYDSAIEWIGLEKVIPYKQVIYKVDSDSDERLDSINNICDLTTCIEEWTQERYNVLYNVTRGGIYIKNAKIFPAGKRRYWYPHYEGNNIGFRIALWIK